MNYSSIGLLTAAWLSNAYVAILQDVRWHRSLCLASSTFSLPSGWKTKSGLRRSRRFAAAQWNPWRPASRRPSGVSTTPISGSSSDSAPHLAALHLAVDEQWFDLAIELASSLGPLYTNQLDVDAFLQTGNLLVRLHLARSEPEPAVQARLRDAGDFAGRYQRPDLAEQRLREASALADRHQLRDLDAEAKFQLSCLLADREEWCGALTFGAGAVGLLRALGRGAAAVPVSINNARLAERAGDLAANHRWAETAWQLASQGVDDAIQASAAFELARAETRSGNYDAAIELWRRAGGLYEDDAEFTNAAIAASNAALMASQQSDIQLATEFLVTAVARWERSDDRDRHIGSLIDLSATQVISGEWAGARSALERARDAAAEPVPTALQLASEVASGPAQTPSDLRAEVKIRQAGLAVLTGDEPPPDRNLTRGIAPTLDEICSLVESHPGGDTADPDSVLALAELLSSRTVCSVDDTEFWFHRELGHEAVDTTALGAGTGAGSDVAPFDPSSERDAIPPGSSGA